jgi:hypothetical protein
MHAPVTITAANIRRNFLIVGLFGPCREGGSVVQS